jgi:hypothetical protein
MMMRYLALGEKDVLTIENICMTRSYVYSRLATNRNAANFDGFSNTRTGNTKQ